MEIHFQTKEESNNFVIELKEKIKAKQDFLKTVPISGLSILVESTGEMVTVYPPSKSSTTAVSVSLK